MFFVKLENPKMKLKQQDLHFIIVLFQKKIYLDSYHRNEDLLCRERNTIK
jgi:hypothetical protein